MTEIKGNQNVYKEVREVRKITDIDEVARLLNSGGWIALATTSPKTPCMFAMGRVLDTQLGEQKDGQRPAAYRGGGL